ncbi:MAG: hypothetical protein JNM27_12550 [Leptospirales bacterium]|nr:hypothetical protein [Leptospirales bacterium]
MKKILTAAIFAALLTGTTAYAEDTADSKSGLITAGRGFVYLVLSPVQITTGLLEGVAALPYYAATGLHALNERLNEASAEVTLADTYNSAYGKDIRNVRDDGETGQVFRRMRDATIMFQKILKQYGVKDSQNYVLTSVDTAKGDGLVLFAVVYRQATSITVKDAEGQVRSFNVEDRLFYEPYRFDSNGTALDRVIDFGGVPLEHARTQKMQAMLLTLAANAVVRGDSKPDYWDTERRWIKGEHRVILQSRQNDLNHKLGIR